MRASAARCVTMRAVRWIAIAMSACLAGCYSPKIRDCQQACGPNNSCPSGLTCSNTVCRDPSRVDTACTEIEPDASPPTADVAPENCTWALSSLPYALVQLDASRLREIDTMLIALVSTSIGLLALKHFYWRDIDDAPRSGAGRATGLEALGEVRAFEAPHTEENYLTHEMGFVLARRHARKLRLVALVGAFIAPALLALFALAFPIAYAPAAWLALALGLLGVFVERWLFFAEARHAVIAYYGR